MEDLKFDLSFFLVFLLLLCLKSLLEIQKLFLFRVEDGIDPVVDRSPLTHDLFISLRVEVGLSVGEQLILLLLPLQSEFVLRCDFVREEARCQVFGCDTRF